MRDRLKSRGRRSACPGPWAYDPRSHFGEWRALLWIGVPPIVRSN